MEQNIYKVEVCCTLPASGMMQIKVFYTVTREEAFKYVSDLRKSLRQQGGALHSGTVQEIGVEFCLEALVRILNEM